MKLFIAINFNTDTRSRLLALSDELRSRSERGKFSRSENLCLPLISLGEYNVLQTAAIKHIMSMITFEPFDVTIERIVRSKNDNGRWLVGLKESQALIDLYEKLTDKLISKGFALNKRKYKPYITIGNKIVTDATPWSFEPFGETVCKINLVKSELINRKLTYTTIFSTGDIVNNYDGRPIPYNLRDIITNTDMDGNFIDFVLKSGDPIITDYSRIKREIIVNDNVISLGKNKNKSEIKSIDELEKKLNLLLLIVHKNNLNRAGYKDGINFVDESFYNIYNPKNKKAAAFIIYQVILDILYDKYLMDSPWLTQNEYCEKHICYDWDISKSNKEEITKSVAIQQGANKLSEGYQKSLPGSGKPKPDNFDKIKAANRFMTEAIKREVEIKNNPALKEDSILLGRNPETYIEFLEERNTKPEKGKKPERDKRKPKNLWDYIYYNAHPRLITSKQFKRSYKNNKKNNNYSYHEIRELFDDYDRFIKAAFLPEIGNNKDYFIKSMDFYHLEIYKRIDFIYKLTVRMETVRANSESIMSLNMDRDILSVKRFHPAVFWPMEDDDNNCLRYDDKHKYYRPSLLIEELWQESLVSNPTQIDRDTTFSFWHDLYLFRAKIYELFNYHCKFVSDDYEDIVKFLQSHYNVLDYHDPNKEWIQTDKKSREQATRIKYALEINDALFWDSDKRKRIKRERPK